MGKSARVASVLAITCRLGCPLASLRQFILLLNPLAPSFSPSGREDGRRPGEGATWSPWAHCAHQVRSFLVLAAVVLLGLNVPGVVAQPSVLYSTGFESSEGFSLDLPLALQSGWRSLGSDGKEQTNGSGLVEDFFVGHGQQAFVGFNPLTGTNDTLSVWHPLNFDPIAAGKPVVKFTVSMAIFDSTNGVYDCFRWSVYNNTNGGTRLFSIDFNNEFTNINYILDDGAIVSTGYNFEPADLDENYDLEVTMNFASNRWSATLNDVLFVSSKPITTKGSALTLGDIDAVWVYGPFTDAPGDNFMVFDNYKVTAEASAPLPFQLESLGSLPNGTFLLRLAGEPARRYALDASTNLTGWTALKTNTAGTDGTVIMDDPSAASSPAKFYRARAVP